MKRLVLLLFVSLGVALDAQVSRPKAELSSIVQLSGYHQGEMVRVALLVSLPEGLHTQSNKPRDETLIPTELIIDAPTGIAVNEIVWPPATDLNQVGSEKPLAVFEQKFAIGVQLSIAATILPGDIVVPARLRYQACDSNLCYPPANATAEWRLRVLPGTIPAEGPVAVFDWNAIKFGTGEKPAA